MCALPCPFQRYCYFVTDKSFVSYILNMNNMYVYLYLIWALFRIGSWRKRKSSTSSQIVFISFLEPIRANDNNNGTPINELHEDNGCLFAVITDIAFTWYIWPVRTLKNIYREDIYKYIRMDKNLLSIRCNILSSLIEDFVLFAPR